MACQTLDRLAARAIVAACLLLPQVSYAQTSNLKVVGFLSVRSADDSRKDAAAFVSGLHEEGFENGRNITIAYRWGDGNYDKLKAHAAELVNMRANVIVGFGPAPALAAKQLTTAIPIIFTSSADPIKIGLVDSLGKPGGNVTGVSYQAVELNAKRLELLAEIIPKANRIGTLVNPSYPNAAAELKELDEATTRIGKRLMVQNVQSEGELAAAMASLGDSKIDALIINGDAFFNRSRSKIIELAAQYRIPTIYPWSDYANDGGLLSYGPSLSDGFRQAGTYAAKVLKGARPVDLPVLQPVKFDFVLNVKTAKSLGLELPPSLLARATETIE